MSPKTSGLNIFEKEPFFEFGFRVVRFKISDDTYESIATNLDEDEFPLDEIRKLYRMRWGIETSYRDIKYDLDLNTLHSRKRNLIQQEIYAKLASLQFLQEDHRRNKGSGKEQKI